VEPVQAGKDAEEIEEYEAVEDQGPYREEIEGDEAAFYLICLNSVGPMPVKKSELSLAIIEHLRNQDNI
jgi:hypothetical protein